MEDKWSGDQQNWFQTVVDLLRSRFQRTTDFITLGRAFFGDTFDREILSIPAWLPDLADVLEGLTAFDAATLEAALRAFLKQYRIKAGDLITVVRTATIGQASGPDVIKILTCLGQERAVQRLRSIGATGS